MKGPITLGKIDLDSVNARRKTNPKQKRQELCPRCDQEPHYCQCSYGYTPDDLADL